MKRKLDRSTSVVACITCAVAATACVLAANVGAEAEPFAYELFEYSDCYADTNCRVPVDTGIDYARRGLKITAQKSGAYAALKTDVAGVFDFEFLPYSATPYGGSDFETAVYDNPYQDIRTMSFVFTDAADEEKSFTLRLEGGAAGNNVTVNASVLYGGTRAGVYYYRDNEAYGSTSGSNSTGVYTFLYGTSFGNVAAGAGAYSASNVRPLRIVFDPDDMRVYGYNYGYGVSLDEKRLIWDFSASENDGRDVGFTLDGFDRYSVKMVFDDIKSGTEPSVVAYSINGFGLSASVLDNPGPSCYVKTLPAVKRGGTLAIPAPLCYDPIDGTVEYSGKVKLTAPSGDPVTLSGTADGDGFYEFRSDMAAALDEVGDYELTYKAKNAAGKFGRVFTTAVKCEGRSAAVLKLSRGGYAYLGKGDTFTPDTGVFETDGKQVPATCAVFDPDGEEMSAPYTFDKYGRYVVRYIATDNEENYTAETYAYCLDGNSALFTGGSNITVTPVTSELNTRLCGLKAESSINNGVITYTQPIKIKEKTANDTIISLMALPKKYGAAAFGQIAITLTDTTDAQNYVTVLVSVGSSDDISTARAASANQTFSGLNGSGKIESFSGGGTPILHSFYGLSNYTNITEQFIDFRFDYAERKVYIGNKLVCDLDDSEHFVSAWDGFSGDEAELTVTLRDMYGESAAVLIREADGKRMAEEYYLDCLSPTISAAFDVNDTPVAIVGENFPILPVAVSDNMDKAPRFTVRVTDSDGTEAEVTDEGFVPQRAGLYTLAFTATDYTGNTVTREFTVEARAAAEPLAISPVGAVPVSAKVGEMLILPSALVTGGCGQSKVAITVEGKTTGKKYTVTDGRIKLTEGDTYYVVYSVTDYLGNTAESRTELSASVTDEPSFDAIPDMPGIFIAGRTYALPVVAAYDYKADKAAVVAISVSTDGAAAKPLDGNMYTPVLTAARSTVTVIYTATGETGTAEMRFDVTAVDLYDDEGYLDLTRYFAVDNVESVSASDECTSFEISESDAKISFVKDVYSHGFELLFDVPSSANNADAIAITLTDAADETKQVRFEAVKGGFADTSTRVNINGAPGMTIAGNFFDAIQHMRISYANDTYAVSDATGLVVGYVKTYLDGRQFRGFSDTVYFDITFKNVTGVFRFDIYRIGNQLMMENDGDYTPPVIVTESEMLRQLRRGETFTVVRAKAFDVLGFETTLSVSVRSANGAILTDASCDEEHTVVLDEYGEYFVVYSASDENYNYNNYTLVVNVRDDTPPEIKVDTAERTVAVGKAFSIKKAQVSDDVRLAESYVFVIDTANNMTNVTDKGSYTPEKKGIYTVRYVAKDGAGNIGIVDVIVKAA